MILAFEFVAFAVAVAMEWVPVEKLRRTAGIEPLVKFVLADGWHVADRFWAVQVVCVANVRILILLSRRVVVVIELFALNADELPSHNLHCMSEVPCRSHSESNAIR